MRSSFLSVCVALVGMASVRASEYDVFLNEVHYHPFFDGADEAAEFVEIVNRGAEDVDISGWYFQRGIEFTFPGGTVIHAGEFLVVSPAPDFARARYGIDAVHGPWIGRLDNGGETIELVEANGRLRSQFHYEDGGAWPSRPDGRGPSLEYTGLDKGNEFPHLWKASLTIDGSPGYPNTRERESGVDLGTSGYVGGVVNEIRGGAAGFVELYNPGSSPLLLGGSALVSAANHVYAIPAGTTLGPRQFLSLSVATLGFAPGADDDDWILVGPDGRILDDFSARLDVPGAAYGRFPDGDDDGYVLDEPSPGATNVYDFRTPVIIHEIQFHPAYVEPAGDCLARCSDAEQWIELHNRSDAPVSLDGWRLTSAVQFDFAPGTTIPARGYLVVAASVASFGAMHPGVANVVGDFSGRLSHSSEEINLRDALGNRVDRVAYGDGKPVNDVAPDDGVDDRTIRISEWPAGADGSGRTLELVHPELDGRLGGSWRVGPLGGTPGAANSAADATPDPVVARVSHEPLVPRSDETVIVSCRISSVGALTRADVDWSRDAGGGSGTVALRDDGQAPDDIAGDGRWAAELPRQAQGQIIRFRVRADSAGGGSAVYPLAPAISPFNGFAGHYYLYEVDDRALPDGDAPTVRLLLPAPDEAELDDRNANSDVLLAATFISEGGGGTKPGVRYHVGVRLRGESSRTEDNRSYRVRFASDDPFDGVRELNLNGSNGTRDADGFTDILSADLFRRAGLPYPQEWVTHLRFPGEVPGHFGTTYQHKENYDDDFLRRMFDGADEGNLYRPRDPAGNREGDLAFRGEDPANYVDLYEKKTNEEEADYSDVIELCRIFDATQTPQDEFVDRVESAIDPAEWARFFAIMACLSNTDGGIWNGTGEDYFLYRVPEDSSRADAGKWLILPWDLEETFRDSEERLFRPGIAAIVRFLSEPRFARLYYRELLELRRGVFSRFEMRQRYDPASLMFPVADVFNVVDPIDAYVTRRLGFYDANIARTLTAGPVNLADGLEVISEGDIWRYWKGTSNPPGGLRAWTGLGYDDGAWLEGASGFGYDDGDDETVLDDMEDGYSTLFTRREFAIEEPGDVVRLTLTVDYDDAFVAYINGQEIGRSNNAPDGDIAFDDEATGSHEASGGGQGAQNPVRIVLDSGEVDLVAGTNVLAMVGLNQDIGSSDFTLIPSLAVEEARGQFGVTAGCGRDLVTTGQRILLRGFAEPVETQSVWVDGVVADFTYVTGGAGPWGIRWDAPASVEADAVSVVGIAARSEPDGGNVVESLALEIDGGQGPLTNVGANVTVDTVWSPEGGPYRIGGRIIVAAGATLEILPGTQIFLTAGAEIVVRGLLLAGGTAQRPVEFRSFDCGDAWGGIAFDGTGNGAGAPRSELRFCIIEGGSEPAGSSGCIAPTNSRLLVEDCTFRRISSNAIDGVDARLEVIRCLFENIFEGVHCNTSTTIIRDSIFRGMIGDTDGIDFDGEGAERSRIEGCLIENGSDDGIDLGGVTVDIVNNVFRNVQDKAISMENPGSLGQPTIVGNLIYRCGTGMAIKNRINLREAHHNTVVGCTEGVNLFAKDAAPDGGHGIFHSMIVWQNVENVLIDAASSAEFDHSNIGGGVFPGEGNISIDPRFLDPGGSFSLAADSPCIGTGRDGSDMGAVPFDGEPQLVEFIRGDSNESGVVDISDAIVTLRFLFQGSAGPACQDILDANDDSLVDISDPIFVLGFLFAGGRAIPAPYPEAGVDPTPDGLACPF